MGKWFRVLIYPHSSIQVLQCHLAIELCIGSNNEPLRNICACVGGTFLMSSDFWWHCLMIILRSIGDIRSSLPHPFLAAEWSVVGFALTASLPKLAFPCLPCLPSDYRIFSNKNSQSQNSQARQTGCAVWIFKYSLTGVLFAERLPCTVWLSAL